MIYLLTGLMSCCLTDFCYFSGRQNKGMDCALWPSLYYGTSMWESVLGDQLNRAEQAKNQKLVLGNARELTALQ